MEEQKRAFYEADEKTHILAQDDRNSHAAEDRRRLRRRKVLRIHGSVFRCLSAVVIIVLLIIGGLGLVLASHHGEVSENPAMETSFWLIL